MEAKDFIDDVVAVIKKPSLLNNKYEPAPKAFLSSLGGGIQC